MKWERRREDGNGVDGLVWNRVPLAVGPLA